MEDLQTNLAMNSGSWHQLPVVDGYLSPPLSLDVHQMVPN